MEMKKTIALIAAIFVLLALAPSVTLAGKPVDADNDGYKNNVDCNDNNASINPGATELCFDGVDNNCDGVIDEGCAGGCTDNDSDGYGYPADSSCTYASEDCNDALASVNPGATEICSNGIDDDCDGLTDSADPQCSGSPHASLQWSDYPGTCLNCHNQQFTEMSQATHYKWVGETPDMVNQTGSQQGKLTNAVNSYCINILGDWKICGKCHAGRGLRPDDPQAGLTNVDCLVCHNADYAKVRTRLADGSMGPPAGTDAAVLNGYVQNIAAPTRTACLMCHANAGGGDAVKRGDISMATITNSDPHFDVHMNTTGSDLQCQSCHVFQNHKTIGKGSDLRPTDDLARGAEVACVTCHAGMDSGSGHVNAGAIRIDADRHVARVSCQACHIDRYAKVETETHRDWRFHHDGSPADGVSGPGHPHVVKAADLKPVMKFWNRQSDNYLLGDAAVLDPATGAYPTSRPLGDINDGKLYPFKYKTADQPMVSSDNALLALDTLVFIGQTGDVVQAITSGLTNMGYSASEPYEWVTTDTYQLLNHGVAPAADVDCAKCHDSAAWTTANDNDMDKLGYKIKDDVSLICAQCHREKRLPSDHERMHGHLQKGSGIGCGFCHSFERPERGLCSPCDASCVAEFVDNVPYPHQCN